MDTEYIEVEIYDNENDTDGTVTVGQLLGKEEIESLEIPVPVMRQKSDKSAERAWRVTVSTEEAVLAKIRYPDRVQPAQRYIA